MREGWTYRRIGDVCTVVGGATPKTEIEEFWGGNHYWITPADLDGSKYQGATPRTITDLAVQKTNLQLLPVGTVLLSSRAPIGKVAITTTPMYCNQGFKNIICSNSLLNEFVYWFLFYSKDYLNSIGTGATFKEISKKTTESIIIPVPTLAEQERIVAELDLLSSIIDKQKAQLKELDNLAQSIFYDMFNEQVAVNEGWECATVGDLYKFQYGKGNKIPESKGIYPCYGSNGMVGYHTEYNSEDAPVIGHIGAYAGIVNWGKGKHFVTYNGVMCWLKGSETNPLYGYYMLKSQNYLEAARNGMAQPFVSYNTLEAPIVYVPPKPLQDLFAEKIQLIESQKESINQSIAESQKLFDYTMDKYFS
jgi:type I restriction enzyme S subunit